MKIKSVFIIYFLFLLQNSNAQGSINNLFNNTLKLYEAQRLSNGAYRDSKLVSGNDYHPISVANTGIGVISLCIADKAGTINDAESKIEKSLETILGYTTGFEPDRTSNGFYRHFLDINNGSRAWNSEYSTIDSALLTLGALFAKKYFPNNSKISQYADDLFLTTDWPAAIRGNGNKGQIYLEMNANGSGTGSYTVPFNEYMLVAYLAYEMENGNGTSGKGTQAWNLFKKVWKFDNANYWGYKLLTDYNSVNAFRSNFIGQFVYYLLNWSSNSNSFKTLMSNAANADKLYYSNLNYGNDVKAFEWGTGAGNSPTNYVSSGYHADDFGNHPGHVVSPHIVAGFIPVSSNAKNDLISMINANKGKSNINGNELLWRYSLDDTGWNSDQIQGVDYSSMLFGLAYDKFGSSFFKTNNNYNFALGGYRNKSTVKTKTIISSGEETDSNDNFTNLSISPNPIKNEFSVSFSLNTESSVELFITNIYGKTVKKFSVSEYKKGNFSKTLNKGNLSSGLYFIFLKTNTIVSKKKILIF